MCGIVGLISDEPVVKDLVSRLGKLEYRGYDSAGIAVVNDGEIVIAKDIGYVSQLKVDKSLLGTIGLGHCRWATHGAVTKENAHPHLDCKGDVAIVHNGIIENYNELKQSLSGHIFKSETDSEVIAHLIEEYSDNDFDMAFILAVQRLKGSYAIVAMHKDYPYLMVARKDSPLMVGVGDGVCVASDIVALGTKEIREIPDGAIEKLSFDANAVKKQDKVNIADTDKGEYPHYMLKEIYEQPSVIVEALKQDKDKLIGISFDILRAKNVILTACGTSRFAAIVGRYLISRLAKKFSEQIVGSELHYFTDSFDNGTLILAVSQSGETADVLTGVRLAKQKGAHIVSMVNREYSSLERLSDATLFMNCGDEIGVAATKSFTSELVLFYLLTFTMANQFDEAMVELVELPKKVAECLEQEEKVRDIARVIKDAEHIYYIGKGINFAVSGECALKLKEISYIHAESMSAGELKHGTLSLIEKGTPIIGLCPDDYTYQETISNLHEAQARGGLVIGISDRYNEVFDYWLPIPKVRDIYYPLVSVIIGQLLTYYVAVERGLNPDRPRSLAKSVTVL